MTTKEYWLTKVKAEMAKLVKNPASATAARELAAASQILYDEMLHECQDANSRNGVKSTV